MKLSTSPDYYVSRPWVLFGRAFAVLALLFCVTVPFMDGLSSRWTFLFVGFAYSAFLAFVGTGGALLPRPLRSRALIAAMCLGPGWGLLASGIMLAMIHFRLPFSLIGRSIHVGLWVSGLSIAVLSFLACYGWYRRLTQARDNPA
ncbi:MAG: hypothetical protein P4L99_11940 [Chthoniobacter sp.]|nr:hypothetical protein [Chthoniobacter sp.]